MLRNQTVHVPDPTNHSSTSAGNTRCPLSEVHWIYGTVICSPHRLIIIPLPRETRGALSEVHWFYATSHQNTLLMTLPELTIPLESPTHAVNNKL